MLKEKALWLNKIKHIKKLKKCFIEINMLIEINK